MTARETPFQVQRCRVPYEGHRETLGETTFELQLGDCAITEQNDAWRVRFDNVVLDVN